MNFLWIEITNFRAFTQTTRLEFPQKPGLYSMQGENGAGKSSVWDALCWCLFDKTSRGLKAGNVCNWSAGKGANVRVGVQTGSGELYTVERNWSPNKWQIVHVDGTTVDITKDESNPALAEMALQYSAFLSCVLIAQSAPMFLDMKQDAQAALFSDIMGLDKWLSYSAAASAKAQACDAQLRLAEREHAKLQGMQEAPRDFAKEVAQFESSRKDRLAELERAYKNTLQQLDPLQAQTAAALHVKEPKAVELKTAQNTVQARRDECTALKSRLRTLDEQQSKNVHTPQCPTCGQDVNTHTLKALEKRLTVEKSLLRVKLNSAEEWLGHATQELIELQDSKEACDKQRTYVQAQARELLRIEQALDALEDKVEQCQAEKNPYEKLQADADKNYERRAQELQAAHDKIIRLNEQAELYSFWVKGFKDIRLQLIDSALCELEIEVNSALSELGLLGWEIKFEVDRVSKSGTLQRGFNAQIYSPKMQQSAPWESWSGGEGQRLRIAVTMGLANLIRSKTGCSLNLEVWDEPSVALSAKGVQALLSKLVLRAEQEQRVIWVTDHTSRSFARFAGVCVAEKHAGGSTLKMMDN